MVHAIDTLRAHAFVIRRDTEATDSHYRYGLCVAVGRYFQVDG